MRMGSLSSTSARRGMLNIPVYVSGSMYSSDADVLVLMRIPSWFRSRIVLEVGCS